MALHPEKPDAGLRGLALCSGVGGLELGLHIAEPGYRTICHVERDAFAASVLVARMADAALCDAPIWDDVRSFDGKPWRGVVDLLTAGYPCQPFSAAGRRAGAADPRHLWPDVARIVDECRPTWIFCENVLGHVDRGFDVVAEDLRQLGYTTKAGLFSAAEVGAAHWRTRLFLLAHADGFGFREPAGTASRCPVDRLADADRSERQSVGHSRSGEIVDHALAADPGLEPAPVGYAEVPLFAPAPFSLAAWEQALDRNPDLQPGLFGLDHGLAHWMERSHASGNGVVSLAAAYAWRTLKAAHLADLKAA